MIYFDYASTTSICEDVVKTYMKLLETYYANSDSIHDLGRETAKLMEQSRAIIAQLFHVEKEEIIFTSCASESNNYAIKGYAWKNQRKGKHLITSNVEHSSILHAMKQLEDMFGFEVTYLPVNEKGVVELQDLKNALRKDTILVSMMHINNEIGAINPIQECADYVHTHSRAAFHMDGVQGLGKHFIDIACVDMASFSAHKVYGLKGSAILYKKKNIELLPLLSGGQQEQGLRAGTSNAPVNIVLAKTIRLALTSMEEHYHYVKELNIYFRENIANHNDFVINSENENSPYILNISCLQVGSEIMLNALNKKGFAVSAQSTCSSKSKAVSKVLLAMGKTEHIAKHAIRISFSHKTTKQEVDELIKALKEINYDYGTNKHRI